MEYTSLGDPVSCPGKLLTAVLYDSKDDKENGNRVPRFGKNRTKVGSNNLIHTVKKMHIVTKKTKDTCNKIRAPTNSK